MVCLAGNKREPEQHADPPGDMHRRGGVAGGVRPRGYSGNARGDERWRFRVRCASPFWLRHRTRRPSLSRAQRGERRGPGAPTRRRLALDGGVSDLGQQPPHGQVNGGIGGDGQQPYILHRSKNQGRPSLRELTEPRDLHVEPMFFFFFWVMSFNYLTRFIYVVFGGLYNLL